MVVSPVSFAFTAAPGVKEGGPVKVFAPVKS